MSVSEFIANNLPCGSGNKPMGTDELSVWYGIHLPYLFPQSESVLRIRDILVRIRMRILGSVPLANGSGCGSGGPKKHTRSRKTGTFTHSSKIKSPETVEINVFLTILLNDKKDPDLGSVLVTIRIRDAQKHTDPDPQQLV